MRRVLGLALVAVVVGVVGVQPQEDYVDPFNGTWHLNIEKTKELSGGESPIHEIITFRIGADGVQHYEVEIQSEGGPLRKGWYSSKYNDPTFVPYNGTVSENPPGAEVMTIKVDERTHYRIARTREGGRARYVMMRRLAEDGQSYISAGLTIDGKPGLYRWMERVSGPR